MESSDEEKRTVWCGNLSDKVTEEILYELFLQAAPLEKVRIPKDKDGRQNSYGFVTFKHLESVNYAIDLLNGTALYDRRINVKPRTGNQQKQNFHKRDNSPVFAPQFSLSPCNIADTINGFDMLIQMGNNFLHGNKVSGRHNSYSPGNARGGSAPYPRWDRPRHESNDRFEDKRSNYRRNNYHRNSDKRNNHTSYYSGRRYDR